MADNMQIITASQIITFDDSSDADRGILRLEIDSRPDGLNGGRTSFKPGDSVGLLLYRSSNVSIIHGPIVTAGTLDSEGTHSVFQAGYLTFADNHDATMGYPIANPSLSWVGNSLGSTKVVNESRVVLTNPPDFNPGAGNVQVGILQYSGNAVAEGFRLRNTNIPDADRPYQIGVFVFGLANPT